LPEVDPSEKGKAEAGARAADAVRPGAKLGLGTGSTVAHFLQALGRRLQNEELPGIVGVPTSSWTESRARELGISLSTLQEVGTLDLTVDGADEVTPDLDLMKGLGGALLREKMVAQATRHLVIIVDEGKLVDRLGTRSPLPVEVVPFSWESHIPFLRFLGARAVIRAGIDGSFFETDNGNFVLDCHFPDGIEDPVGLQDALAKRAGIVESGLFLGMANEVFVGSPGRVANMVRERE
jgi:ribose 5-phosphate isomerase A